MNTCVIFCAGGFTALAEEIRSDDCVIAADGGLTHIKNHSIRCDCVLGDFDSLGFVPEGANVFPVEKDDTDAMLAVRRGLAMGYRRFVLYGSLDGPRLDHTIANLQTLQYLCDHGATGYLVGETYIATVVSGERVTFPAGAEGILSLFCLGRDASGVTITGLKYPLEDGTLTSGFPLGVSNHFTGTAASVTVKNGSLLMLYGRENGFPGRDDRI